MLRTACTAMLLLVTTALAGCSQDASAQRAPAAAAPTSPPRLGACRVLAPRDIGRSSNDSPTVACTRPHTAQTFAVGTFPSRLATRSPDEKALGAYVYHRCKPGFERFVGADDSLVLRSTLDWAWFRPTAAAWAKSAHTWRCDVVAGDERSKTLDPLPRTAKGLLLGKPADRWLACVDGPTVSGSVRTPCSRPHTWRAVTTIVLGKPGDPYPGDRLSQVRTRDYCSDSVGAWLNYPVDYDFGFTWFHEAEWKAGNRRAVCWARTDQ